MRRKVEVLNFPTQRRMSKTEQYKYFSERSTKKCGLNYGPQFIYWIFVCFYGTVVPRYFPSSMQTICNTFFRSKMNQKSFSIDQKF